MLHSKFPCVEIGPLVPEKKILKGFYHIWAGRQFWSDDQHHVYKSLFLCTQKFTYKFRYKSPVVSEKSKF